MANSRKALRGGNAGGLLKHFRSFLDNHLQPQARITLGLSGGLDSCVLLHLLVQVRQSLNFQLSAIHVNHQISPNAGDWVCFCEKLCVDVEVPLAVVKVDVARDSGLGLEAAAREARYGALLKHGADALLLAHHQDDQAETLLLQLLRGAGVEGLSAMSAVGKMGITPILRPLLDVSRVVLQNYAQQHGLQWVEDESNQDARFDRNFLRLEVLPLLKTRFPACVTTLARSAANFADSAEILQQLAEEDAGGDSDAGRLDLTILKNLPPPRAVNVLRWWIYNASGQKLSRSRLLEIYSQLVGARAEARIECVLGSVVLRRYRQWAVIDCGAAVESYRLEWHGDGALSLPDGSRLVLEKSWGKGLPPQLIANGLLVTNRAGKPANGRLEMRLGACGKMRTLKNLWQEAGVPMWERDRMPLLWIDGSLAAVPGLGVSTDLAVGGDVAGVIPGWVND